MPTDRVTSTGTRLATRVLTALGLWGAAFAVGACTPTQGPLWGPDSPRNGAEQPVDPVYGTPLPGYPSTTGGSRG
jgi:hypothetical protein